MISPDLNVLAKKLFAVLDSEINSLVKRSRDGKLTANESRMLKEYLTLLMDIHKKQSEQVSSYTDEELQDILEDHLSTRNSK